MAHYFIVILFLKDDLVPDKLERPDDSLSEAMKFLTPLQLLAPDAIETHFFAFEIYYRKGAYFHCY